MPLRDSIHIDTGHPYGTTRMLPTLTVHRYRQNCRCPYPSACRLSGLPGILACAHCWCLPSLACYLLDDLKGGCLRSS